MKKCFLLSVSLFLLGSFNAQAQNEEEKPYQIKEQKFGMSFVVNEALHQYSKNLDQSPMGLAFTYLETKENSNFSYGAEVGISMYASEKYTENLSQKGYNGAFADVEEEDCYFTYQVLGRYNLNKTGMFNLYAEARVGGATFFTDKRYTDVWGNNAPKKLKDEFTFNSTTFQASYGGGIMLNLDKINNDVSLPISIEFNVNRVMGAAAKYRNIAFDEASNTYKNSTLYKSQTSSLAYRIGIYYNLD